MPVYLAYDGTINGDWIARYAIRMAANDANRRLQIIHVENADTATSNLAAAIKRIESEATMACVETNVEICPMHQGVFGGLINRIPEGADTFLVCGVRIKSRRQGYLHGTISEKLLHHRRFNVMALRIVKPGLLGYPRNVLTPVFEDPKGFRLGMPFMRLLSPEITRLHILRVMTVRRFQFRHLSVTKAGMLRNRGLDYVHRIEAELIKHVGFDANILDPIVRVSDDWVKEIIIQAGHLKTDLIYMKAPKAGHARSFIFGDPVEEILRDAHCDISIYRGIG